MYGEAIGSMLNEQHLKRDEKIKEFGNPNALQKSNVD